MKIILLNGPPRAGKDSCANILALRHGFIRQKMAAPLYQTASSLLGWSFDEIEARKADPCPLDPRMSVRQFLILISEEWMKPWFGDEIFGTLAVSRIQRLPEIKKWVFSDTGFASEVQPLLRLYGPEAFLLVQLIREGCTFQGDSRSYISLEGIQTTAIHNNKGLIDLIPKLDELIKSYAS